MLRLQQLRKKQQDCPHNCKPVSFCNHIQKTVKLKTVMYYYFWSASVQLTGQRPFPSTNFTTESSACKTSAQELERNS